MNDIELELKSIRYLMNNIILGIYDIRNKLDEIKPTKRSYNMVELCDNGSDIRFDLFYLPKQVYQELVKQYGMDTINKACCLLDSFIKENNYIPYKTPRSALKNKFILEVLTKDKKDDTIKLDISDVVDSTTAKIFIEQTPEHLRSIDKDCREVYDKFLKDKDNE